MGTAIVSGVIGLLGVALGFFLSVLSQRLSEGRQIVQEFESIRASILVTRIANNLYLELKKLREFFIRYPGLLTRHSKNEQFFGRWLMQTGVEMGISASCSWTVDQMTNMKNELCQLQVKPPGIRDMLRGAP